MLDQNTDRMWYVIGAVLIGAAIIFGMNTLMPEAFASVSSSFEDMTARVNDRVYLAFSDENFIYDGEELRTNYSTRGSWYDVNPTNLRAVIGHEMRVSFEIRNPEGTGGNVDVLFADRTGKGIENGSRIKSAPLNQEWTEYSDVFIFNQYTYDGLMEHGRGYMSVRTNLFTDGNGSINYPHEVRNVVLEVNN